MKTIDTDQYRVRTGVAPSLSQLPTRVDTGLDRKSGRVLLKRLHQRFVELQNLLYAERRHSVLIVLQAMDAAGKDSTIRRCFGVLNPQRCRTVPFKKPTQEELRHDFLWRVHQEAPPRGMIHVFNRSHYEDVLVVRVRNLVEESVWQKRYQHINTFEELLTNESTTVIKFYLHISKEYQGERLRRRLARPDKRWKFNPGDLDERALWEDYQRAYEAAFTHCSTDHAPWYIVPAEQRWFRDVVVTQVLVEALERLDPQWPEPDFDPQAINIE